jgi:hypothetical protein
MLSLFLENVCEWKLYERVVCMALHNYALVRNLRDTGRKLCNPYAKIPKCYGLQEHETSTRQTINSHKGSPPTALREHVWSDMLQYCGN